jgi:FtsP/CotA-like multicopper oxidase with cupredoxin domain
MQTKQSFTSVARRLSRAIGLLAGVAVAAAVQAAAPGIKGSNFDLVAAAGNISQPDGAAIYSWGYGCNVDGAGTTNSFVPAAIGNAKCPAGTMQLPGPTLVVTQGSTVTVTLHNNLPAAAGNTSMLFPGFQVSASGGVTGLLTQEAAHSGTVTYSFTADVAGTHSYYSGTQGDLQVEMGMYGALIVLPGSTGNSAACANAAMATAQNANRGAGTPRDFRLASAAYDHASACYDREYLVQTSEIDPRIHTQAAAQAGAACSSPTGCMSVETEPYHAVYFLINGRSFPDDMDANYAPQYPMQPYNANPHMHPGELTLVRIVGQGRMQHPFHEHANHVRLLARDGQMLLNSNNKLSGPLLFTTTTNPGQTMDALFQYTAKNLNWDVYGHKDADANGAATDEVCTPDTNGYHSVPTDNNYFEWCADHKKALENKPFGNVGSGGPVTLPDANVLVNGAWYAGSPYLGPDATARAAGPTPIPPFGTIANDPGGEAGFAFMWHSHNEREITTNNIFPGGLMTMMLVDPWVYLINESN